MTRKKDLSSSDALKAAGSDSQRWRWDLSYSRGGSWKLNMPRPLHLPKGSRVLEIGCGNGKTLSEIKCEGCELYAIDSSKKAVELCNHLISSKGIKADVRECDARSLPFRKGFFDFVIVRHVLENLLEKDREKVVSEVHRVLKKEGCAIVRVFSRNDMRYGKGHEVEPHSFLHGNRLLYHYFSEQELRELFSGFEEKELLADCWNVDYSDKCFKREVFDAVFLKR